MENISNSARKHTNIQPDSHLQWAEKKSHIEKVLLKNKKKYFHLLKDKINHKRYHKHKRKTFFP